MHHLTIRQLDEILWLSNVVKRDWNGMSHYLRLDHHDSCPRRHEIEGCPEYQKLQDVVDRLIINALDELVALCLLGDAEPDESNTLDDSLRNVQSCPPDHRPPAELFEVENLFDNPKPRTRAIRRRFMTRKSDALRAPVGFNMSSYRAAP